MNNRLLFAPLLLAAAVSLACSCRWFDTREALQDLFDESDVVLAGVPIRSVSPEKWLNKRFVGINVLLRVTRRYKGQLRADTVLVLQEEEGNCARRFLPQDTVIIFGRTVRQVRKVPRDEDTDIESGLDDSTHVYYLDRPSRYYHRFRRLQRRYSTLTTSQCVSFTRRNSLATAFMRGK